MLMRLVSWLPRNHAAVYQACQRVVDQYRGENNDNPASNGEYRYLRSALPGARLVFDVGANVGDWTAVALSINPALEVHCFEPARAAFDALAGRPFPASVHRNHFGLSSAVTETEIHLFGDRTMLTSLYARTGLEGDWNVAASDRTERVRLETVDHYLERHAITTRIDLCKLDVEGHELEVLAGMTGALARRQIGDIQFEYGGTNIDSRVLLKDFFDFFGDAGYELFKMFPGELRHVSRYSQLLENFRYQNWLAVPRSA